MSDFDIKFGPWLNYGKKNEEVSKRMDELVSQSWSPFNGWDIAHVFIYCMAYAFANKIPPSKTPGSSGSMPASAFKREMRDFMKALAIEHEQKLDVIADPKRVVEIGQDYAFAGFNEVYNRVRSRSEDKPEKILEDILYEVDEQHSNTTKKHPDEDDKN